MYICTGVVQSLLFGHASRLSSKVFPVQGGVETGCLIFIGHFPQKSPITLFRKRALLLDFAKQDVQFKASLESSLPCTMFQRLLDSTYTFMGGSYGIYVSNVYMKADMGRMGEQYIQDPRRIDYIANVYSRGIYSGNEVATVAQQSSKN